MLIAIIGQGSLSADILNQLSVRQQVVAVLRPGHGLSCREVKDLTRKCYVIEYLSDPDSMIEILFKVFSHFKHLLYDTGPVTVINRAGTGRELVAESVTVDDREIDWALDPSGEIAEVRIGSTIAQNSLLGRFFGLLHETKIEDQRGLGLLQQTFEGLKA